MMEEASKSQQGSPLRIKEYYDQQWSSSSKDLFALAFRDALQHSYTFLGDLRGKKLLEIGCGSGEQACFFALHGAEVTVIDISLESLKMTKKLAEDKKLTIYARQMNAEQLSFPSGSFDLVYINSTLMHVNKLKVFEECSRILNKDGKAVIVEPLQYAPFVQLYRLFSSYRRMKPKYATFKMFQEGKKYFSLFQHKEFYFLAPLFLPVYRFNSVFLHEIYNNVAIVDSWLVHRFPLLQKLCWVSVTECDK